VCSIVPPKLRFLTPPGALPCSCGRTDMARTRCLSNCSPSQSRSKLGECHCASTPVFCLLIL
jgi:hypothetical protein